MGQTALNPAAAPAAPEQGFFLSELLGARVVLAGKRVGKLSDLVIKETGSLPLVTHLCVSLPFGESALVPWENVESVTRKEVAVAGADIAQYRGEPPEHAVLLKDHILDKKAIDLEGRDLEVVYDVKLALRNHRLYVTDVDLSHYGLLRRMGLTRVASFIYNLAESIREQTVSWKYIQPLPEQIDRFRGDVKLNVLKERLADMHPVDLADILEEMDPEQRVELFEGLPTEQASDTLEEIEPNAQRDLVSALDPERAAELIDAMTPGQAADVLAVLSTAEADPILDRLSPDTAEKVRSILDEHEERPLDFAIQEYIAFPPDQTAEQARRGFREAARGKEVLYAYVVDDGGRLLGVLDIRELLLAEDDTALRDAMVANVITLAADSTLKDAAEIFRRYGFRALPVVDAAGRLLGILKSRDVLGLEHRFVT